MSLSDDLCHTKIHGIMLVTRAMPLENQTLLDAVERTDMNRENGGLRPAAMECWRRICNGIIHADRLHVGRTCRCLLH